MNWAWATSLDQLWRSAAFPMWLTLAAAGFFALIVLTTLLRAEKSVANGALTVITLVAVGIAVAATIRGSGHGDSAAGPNQQGPSPPTMNVSLPALSCIDDLAGETVLAACEKVLFGSAESAATAVSYAASRITQLTTWVDTAGNKTMTPEMQALQRAVEHDRYGLLAQALVARDHCTLSECAAFRVLTDSRQIVSNMDQRMYDGLISRYAPSWNAPAAAGPVAALVPSMPTGKPTNAEFPSSASIPPVSIMTPEPGQATPPAAPRTPTSAANAPSPHSTSTTGPTLAAAKKPPAPKPPRPAPPAPVPLAPAAPLPPAAAND
jgi:hypothetical protein